MTVATEIRIGEAGHCGRRDSLRSSCAHRTPRRAAALRLSSSRGSSRTTATRSAGRPRKCWKRSACAHAQVSIHDEGALPFVIAARIEAAVRRAGLGEGTRVLPDGSSLPGPSAAIASGARGSTFPAASPSISSMPRCTGRCHHSRSGRLGSCRGKRCCAAAGAQCAARRRFPALRAHGAHQPASPRTGGSRRDCPRVAGSDPDSEGRKS